MQGPGGEDHGEVENVIANAEGMAGRIIVEAGGLSDMDDTHVSVPWSEAEIAEIGPVTVPVSEENVDGFSLFETRGPVEGPADEPREWRVAERIGDHACLEDGACGVIGARGVRSGGEMTAVVVEPDLTCGDVGPYGHLFDGCDSGFDPDLDHYALRYATVEAEDLPPCDHDDAGH